MDASLSIGLGLLSTGVKNRSLIGSIVDSSMSFLERNRIKSRICCIVAPIGKSTIASKFNQEYSTSGYYMCDIEQLTMDNLTEPQRKALEDMRITDIFKYNTLFYGAVKEQLMIFMKSLTQYNKDTTVVILVSTRQLKNVLGLKSFMYVFPSQAVQQDLISVSPKFKTLIEFAKSILSNKKNIQIYNSAVECYELICRGLEVARKM